MVLPETSDTLRYYTEEQVDIVKAFRQAFCDSSGTIWVKDSIRYHGTALLPDVPMLEVLQCSGSKRNGRSSQVTIKGREWELDFHANRCLSVNPAAQPENRNATPGHGSYRKQRLVAEIVGQHYSQTELSLRKVTESDEIAETHGSEDSYKLEWE
ncbi:hypothetical protein M569_00119 [Genlisea aurea]|uniref:Uncharacterized protein n=1 Tax=Genlisea aurea TaxID=192259 RepID=S8D5E4_9LAMI|nr:hypothetical protein M569_00119 [Genlisea aurea]